MPRLEDKNILLIIPKDYYDESQLDPLREILINEGAEVKVASSKFKEAVGMKTGRHMPDMLIVDAIEGITGDSYVTAGKGTRQVKGVFHGTIIIGGKGARKYLWDDRLVRLLISDRYKSKMVVGAIGSGTPCLGEADLIANTEVAAADDKHTTAAIEKAAGVLSDQDVVVHERMVTAKGGEAIEEFAEEVIKLVSETKLK